jgi:dihydroxyacetone kinase
MSISAKMLALIQKIEAADAEHFARLRKSAKQDKEAKALAKVRATARSAESRTVAKKRKAS